MILGNIIDKEGTPIGDFKVDMPTFFQTNTLLQGMTRSGKTNLILKMVEELQNNYPEVRLVFLDAQDEFDLIADKYENITLVSKATSPHVFDIERAFSIGNQTRRLPQSVIIKLSDFKKEDRPKFVAKFVEGFNSAGKEIGFPFVFFIDEANLFCPRKVTKETKKSQLAIIDQVERSIKNNIVTVLATQTTSGLDIDARRECANRLVGKTTELGDRNIVEEMMGDKTIGDSLWSLKKGEFYVRGDAIGMDKVRKVQIHPSSIKKIQAGLKPEQKAKLSNEFESLVENKNDLSYLEILQKKVADLEQLLKLALARAEYQYNEGFRIAEQQYKEKSTFQRLMKK